MKKVAIGCLIVAGVLIVVLGIGGFLLYRAASPFLAGVRQLAEIPEIEKTIANTSSFEPPASGELTEEMVNRFAAVQEAVQAKLSGRVNELRTKVDQIDRAIKEQDRKASPTEVFSALSGLATLVVEGKRAQVEAINKAGFSRREYLWVRRQVYQAAGLTLTELSLGDPQALAQAAQDSGGLTREVTRPDAEVPARNKELVAPYQSKLKEWIAFGMVGL